MTGHEVPLLAFAAAVLVAVTIAFLWRMSSGAKTRRAPRVRPLPTLTRWTELELERRARLHRRPKRIRRRRE